jgi:5-methylthioadenosine/S-adenosylhomocysteine deaminase
VFTLNSLLLKDASWIVTVDRRRRILRDCSILIEDGLITEVSKDAKGVADTELDCKGKLVIPGFVNCHAHISYGHALRGVLPDEMGRGEYLRSLFGIQRWMTEEEERSVSLYAMGDLLMSGYTTLLEPGTVNNIRSVTDAAQRSGIRIVCGTHFLDVENPFNIGVSSTSEARKKSEHTLRRIISLNNRLITPCVSAFSPMYCTDELLLSLKELSESYKVTFTMHLAEDEGSVKRFLESKGKRPVQYLDSKGILGGRLLLAHAVFLTNNEVTRLAQSQTRVAFCPSSSVRGSGAGVGSKLPEMLEKGVVIGLGTDSAVSSYYQDPFRVMYLCSVIFKDGRRDRSLMSPEKMIEISTIRAAEALGMNDEVGSIEVGKRADIVVLRMDGPEWTTCFYPPYNLVYSADKSSVDTVLVDGRVLVKEGIPVTIDMTGLKQEVERVADTLIKRSGHKISHVWKVAPPGARIRR